MSFTHHLYGPFLDGSFAETTTSTNRHQKPPLCNPNVKPRALLSIRKYVDASLALYPENTSMESRYLMPSAVFLILVVPELQFYTRRRRAISRKPGVTQQYSRFKLSLYMWTLGEFDIWPEEMIYRRLQAVSILNGRRFFFFFRSDAHEKTGYFASYGSILLGEGPKYRYVCR